MDPRVQAIITLMKANLHRQLPLREMAESAHLSESHLRQLFKEETGTSLARYLRELRMQRSKDLLETTFLSVKEVATQVGISGLSHFVRDFENTFGMTPARYVAHKRKAGSTKAHEPEQNRQIG